MPTAMPAPEPTPPKRRTKRRLWLVLTLLAATPFVLLCLWHIALSRAIEKELAAIRERGEPVSASELPEVARDPTPEELEAVRAFGRAVAAIDMTLDGESVSLPPIFDREGPKPHEPLGPEKLATAIRYLEHNAEAIRLLGLADEMPLVGLMTGTDAMPFARVYGEERTVGQLRHLQATVAAERGDVSAATHAILAGFTLAERFDQSHPFNLTYVTTLLRREAVRDALERVMNRAQLDEKSCLRIAAAIREIDDDSSFRRALVGERAYMLDYFQEGLPLFGDGFGEMVSIFLYRSTGFAKLDKLVFLRQMRSAIEVGHTKNPKRLNQINALDLESDGIRALYIRIGVVGYIRDTALASCLMEARLETAHVALQVERFRLADSRLPESLDDLVPRFLDAIPPDPFTGGPLRYKKLDKGYVVYSVGEDGVDDVGEGEGDIAFTVRR